LHRQTPSVPLFPRGLLISVRRLECRLKAGHIFVKTLLIGGLDRLLIQQRLCGLRLGCRELGCGQSLFAQLFGVDLAHA